MSNNGIEKIKNISNINTSLNKTSFSDAETKYLQPVESTDMIDFDLDKYKSDTSNEINPIKRTGATLASGTISLLEGVGNFVEAVSDTLAVASTAVVTPFTGLYDLGQSISYVGTGTIKSIKNDDNFKKNISNEFNQYKSLTKKMWDYQSNYVSKEIIKDEFDKLYDNTQLGKNIKAKAYDHENMRSIGSGIGKIAGIVGTAVATQGASVGLTGATVSSSSFSAFLSSIGAITGFGEGTQESWKNGASITEGLEYGASNAAWQGTQYLAGAKINAIKVGGNAIENAAVRVGLDSITGASEGISKPAMDTIYKTNSYSELFNENGGWTNVATSAALAAGMSAMSELSGLAEQLRYKDEVTVDIKEILDDSNKALEFQKLFGDKDTTIRFIRTTKDVIPGTDVPLNYIIEYDGKKYFVDGYVLNNKVGAAAKHILDKPLKLTDSEKVCFTGDIQQYIEQANPDKVTERIKMIETTDSAIKINNLLSDLYKEINGLPENTNLSKNQDFRTFKENLTKYKIDKIKLKSLMLDAGMDISVLSEELTNDELVKLGQKASFKIYSDGAVSATMKNATDDITGVPYWTENKNNPDADWIEAIIRKADINNYSENEYDFVIKHLQEEVRKGKKRDIYLRIEQVSGIGGTAYNQGAFIGDKMISVDPNSSYGIMNELLDSMQMPSTYEEYLNMNLSAREALYSNIRNELRKEGIERITNQELINTAIGKKKYQNYAITGLNAYLNEVLDEPIKSGNSNLAMHEFSDRVEKAIKQWYYKPISN